MVTLGVLADTHIPDRAKELHPEVIPLFRERRVEAILHAGDLCIPKVIEQLQVVAPVYAVRGNRDWFGFDDLPMQRMLEFEGIRIGMTHGHGSWRRYLWDKLDLLIHGLPKFSKFMERAFALVPEGVDVVVFGHNHAPMNRRVGDKLAFNPGSASQHIFPYLPPSVGLLHVGGGEVEGEIVPLSHWRLR